MWYRLATIINDEQFISELRNNATTSDDIKNNYRMLARKYHPDVNQDPDSTDNFKNLTRVYEEVREQPILFKQNQSGEKRTTSEEVKEYLKDAEDIRDGIGILVSTYFVRNVPEEYDTPDYTVDDAITEEIFKQIRRFDTYDNIAQLINQYCREYIKENY